MLLDQTEAFRLTASQTAHPDLWQKQQERRSQNISRVTNSPRTWILRIAVREAEPVSKSEPSPMYPMRFGPVGVRGLAELKPLSLKEQRSRTRMSPCDEGRERFLRHTQNQHGYWRPLQHLKLRSHQTSHISSAAGCWSTKCTPDACGRSFSPKILAWSLHETVD